MTDESPEQTPPFGSGKKRVLVVDDSFIMRRVIKEVVESDEDLEVVDVAEDGKVALQKVRQLKPDLILLDIEMPEMSGLETLRRLGLRSTSKVVILSSLGTEGSTERAEALRLGAADVLAKPSGAVSLDLKDRQGSEIVRTVRRVLGLPPRAVEASEGGDAPSEAPVGDGAESSAKALYRELMSALPSGVMAFDRSGNLIAANEAAARILGHKSLPKGPATLASLFSEFNETIGQDIRDVLATGVARAAEEVEFSTENGDWMPLRLVVRPLPGSGALAIFEDVTRERDMRKLLEKTVSRRIATSMLGEGASELGGALVKTTILFSDVRSFTTLSEVLGAAGIVKLLNEYFSFMADIIRDNGGSIDKYIGDAIMALFGAPLAHGDDADRAVLAAVGMLDALDLLNRERERTKQMAIHIGIGLATGEVIAGNIGSPDRMNYTVIGDAVNLAARLESLTKGYGASLLVCSTTHGAFTRKVSSRKLDVVRVKGQDTPTVVYEVFQKAPGASASAWLGAYEAGLTAYQTGDFSPALASLKQASGENANDKAAKMLIERCQKLLAEPPAQWDGVWTLHEK
ncbi:MAG: response regulator [Vicinamibacteria bacterium]|nr:response regulator [Vicinamibacteria bacterium]